MTVMDDQNNKQNREDGDTDTRARTLSAEDDEPEFATERDEIEHEKRGHPTYQPFQAGFWDKDPETTKHRTIYLKISIMGVMFTILAIFAYLSIYWGSLWSVETHLHGLNGWIVVSNHCIGCFQTRPILNLAN